MAEVESINGNPIVADISSESITPVVDAWLTAHPEATATVADGAITTAKLANGAVTDAKLAQTGGILEAVRSVSIGKNLIGNEVGRLYPTPIMHVGDKVTFSTKSGANPLGSTRIDFYDADGNRLDYYTFPATSPSRTVSVLASMEGSCYISRNAVLEDIQVEIGSTATAYEPFFGNSKYLYEQVDALYDADAANVSKRLLYSNGGRQTFKGLGNFQHYGLNTSGGFLLTQRYRVSNDDWMTFDEHVTAYVASGFRLGIVALVDGSATWYGWYTCPITIPAGTVFNAQIARVSEITSETANVDEFLDAVTFENTAGTVEGTLMPDSPKVFSSADFGTGLWENGFFTHWNQAICTMKLYPVKAGNRFEYSDSSGKDFSFAVLDKDDLSSKYFSGWLRPQEPTVYTFDMDGYLTIQYKSSGTLLPSSYSGNCTLYYGAVDAYDRRLDAIESAIDVGGKPFSYVGARIPSRVNTFGAENLLTMSYTDITSQDIECFGDYLFVAFSGTEQIRVYSMTSKELLGTIYVETQHGTGMQFSNEYYESGDEFPLLYVGGWTGNYINVLRIANDGGTWSAEGVRRLVIPTSYGYYMAPSIDAEHGTLYAYGYKNMNNQPNGGNSMKLVKADLGQLTDNGDGTYTPKILSDMEMPYLGVTQGRKYLGGSLYVGFANTGSPYNARLVAIDATTGDVTADVPMSSVTSSESEGVCYRINGSEIEWYYSDYYNVYKVSF